MSRVAACPHCRAENPRHPSFCAHCGLALPGPCARPRIVSSDEVPQTTAGRVLLQRALQRGMRLRASRTLLAIAVLQLAGTVVLLALGSAPAGGLDAASVAMMLGLAGLFFGLALWSRHQPLPAALTGCVIFATLLAGTAVLDPSSLATPGVAVKGMMLLLLIHAIQSGLRHRRLVAATVAAWPRDTLF